VWEHSTADFEGEHYPTFEQIRVLPLPAHRIPVWIGGGAPAAIERALRHDGYHAIGVDAAEMPALVATLRARRPDPDFAISLRVGWDVTSMDPAAMAEEAAAYREAGVDALHVAPDRGDIETWMHGQEVLAGALLS
jgi:hypothetical protein